MQNDGALIRQILSGDQTAFAELVKKYQKQVHVLRGGKLEISTLQRTLPRTPF